MIGDSNARKLSAWLQWLRDATKDAAKATMRTMHPEHR